jgi:hypothetical protein
MAVVVDLEDAHGSAFARAELCDLFGRQVADEPFRN